ncbi:diguanylate cyclase [bacterium]|nr:diguanylate cyclase [bacterium]MBU1072395.1 diguanylate cyclase [bacterium]MBU1675021.1 diguanylate cyclase [bacterium]
MIALSPSRTPFRPACTATCSILLALCCVLVAPGADAGAPGDDDLLWVDATAAGAMLCGHMHYLVDPDGALGLVDVLDPRRRDDWRDVKQDVPNFGYTGDTYWLRFRMGSRARDCDDYLLEIAYPLLDDVTFHQVRDGQALQVYRTGDALPFAERPVEHATFVFPATMVAGEQYDFLLRIRSTSSLQAPLAIWSERTFQKEVNRSYALYGFFYGVMLSIMVYGAAIFLSMRERNYLYFVAYSAMFVGIKASMDGIAYQYLWPFSPFFQEHCITFFLSATTAAAYFFASHFLQLKTNAIRLNRFFMLLARLSLLGMALALVLPYAVMIRPTLVLALAAEFLVLATGGWIWRKCGSRPALMFTGAWSAFLAGSLLMILSKFGVLPRTIFTENGPALGIMAEAAFLIIALTESLKESRRKQRQSATELLRVQAEASRELKREVQRQTAAIQDMMRQLARANEELDERNKLDGLTGIFNRHAFDERLAADHNRAGRSGSPLSLLMIDIDLFKNFNDDYGHLTGDECLKRVAATIAEEARRTTDFAARYGGEEFAVILADTPAAAAALVGERIRAAIAAMDFRVDDTRVPVSVSVGVGTSPPGADAPAEALVAAADEALYLAKANGRDRVEAATAPAPQPAA